MKKHTFNSGVRTKHQLVPLKAAVQQDAPRAMMGELVCPELMFGLHLSYHLVITILLGE